MRFYFIGGLWPELRQALEGKGHECYCPAIVKGTYSHLGIVGETDVKRGNERLFQDIMKQNTEVLVVFKGFEHENMRVTADTIQRAKKRGIFTIYWSLDDPFFFDLHGHKYEHTTYYDCILTCCEGLLERYRQECGHDNVHLLYPAWDRVLWQDVTIPEHEKVDFTIVGSAYQPPLAPLSRFQVAHEVLKAGYEVEIYGPVEQWEVDKRLMMQHKGFWGVEDMDVLYNRTRVNFTSHIRPDGYKYLNSRVFEVLGTGNFLLTDNVAGIREIFDDRHHLVIFNDVPHLVEQVQYYVEHVEEREAIAAQGKQWIIDGEHTYTGRANEMLSYIR